MKGFFRRLKIAYALYNFFQRPALQHNIALFKKYGIKKKYFASISSKDFANLPPVWPAVNHTKPVTGTALFQSATPEDQKSMLSFEENGFLVLKNYLTPAAVTAVNNEIDHLLASHTLQAGHRNKIMFAIHHSALLKNMGQDARLLELLSSLLQGEAILFQSINFTMGSEQHTHSDSIHMTTFPLGGLLGAWIALDDIHENNGPLHYYPGSHHLPYYLNSDYNNEGSAWLLGKKSYTDYEAMIAEKIAEKGLEKKIFTASRGDLLVWHANLFHGGEPHRDKNQTRKSMVFHYFKKDAICYHEITQRPALLPKPFLYKI